MNLSLGCTQFFFVNIRTCLLADIGYRKHLA